MNELAERLREYRGRLRAAHRRGAAGGETAREMTRFWDGALATLFETASAGRDGFALFAAGSLGREMMSPYSDVDFFLVARDDIPDAVLESVAETMLYPLWDAKVRTGQRIHRAGVLADLARTDAELLTALLDARFIAGDALVRAGVEHRVGELIEYGRRHIEIPRPAPDVADAEYPPTAHVLEPDVKLSPGGLRDYMFAMWNAALALGRDDLPAHLVREHLATRVGLVELAQAVEFLMRVRHELHFSAHAPQDRLRAAAQPEVALALGFAGAGEAEAAKSLLRDYFAAADRIHAFERRVRELRAEAHRHPRDDLVPGAAASGDYLILPDDLPERIGHDGKRLFELFARIGDEGLVLTERTRHRLRGLAALIDDEFREDESVAAAFRALLASDRAAAALRALHSIGVLGAYVPQFGALEGLIPYDVSHAYPADEHTLLVIEFFDRLRAGLGPERFVDAAKSLARPDLVRLVLLLHDTGKAGGPGHRERGARLAPVACLRLSLAADETDFVVRLVREHESLAYAAYTRDVDDPAVARDLAAHIGDADALDALFVLTYCDMRAVGPGVFTPWRGGLIAALYDRVAEALSPGAPREAGDDRATRVRAALAGAFDAALVDDYIARMQAHHPAWLSPELAARHLTALSRYRVESKPVVDVHWDDDASGELVFCAPDAPGLLAVVAGVCVAERLSVLSLQAVTMEQTGDGSVALDTAQFQWHEAAPPRESVRERIGERLAAHVDDVLAGRARVQDLVAAGARRVLGAKAVAPIATEVRIDNHAAPRHTIVEVATADRFGLLYLVTHAIHEFGLSIALAKVNTIAGRAIDAFYVLDADGQKVARSAAPALREAITAAVKSPI